MTRRAVITGAGAVSPLGVGLAALHDGLAAARVAIAPIASFDAATFPVRVAGEVPDGTLAPARIAERLAGLAGGEAPVERWRSAGAWRDRKTAFAALAAAEAYRDAGFAADPPDEAWLSIGLGLPHAFLDDFAAVFDGARMDYTREDGAGLPSVRFRSRVDLAASVLSDVLDLGGPIIVNASACAAGALAVAHAATLIERGRADVVLCGAADCMVNPLGLGGMAMLGATSPRAEATACRPFDRRRDGIVIGEGAALFVVENEERARARGARIRARLLGAGSSQDAYKPSAPDPSGAQAARAIRHALARAGLPPSAIDYVNAHGTGTPLNDVAEVRALAGALGEHAGRVPVSSIKGAVGHLMGAAGAVELAACLLAFDRGLLPGTANCDQPDPECAVDVIGPAGRAARPATILSNSFGFGGQNGAVILGAP